MVCLVHIMWKHLEGHLCVLCKFDDTIFLKGVDFPFQGRVCFFLVIRWGEEQPVEIY